jgi:arylsulfatase A-like enzyme
MVSLRSGRWKLISNLVSSQLIEKPRYELFDLEGDPGERVNVADRHPDVVQRLDREIAAHIKERWQAPSAQEGAPDMDPEVLEQLRALGYVDDN